MLYIWCFLPYLLFIVSSWMVSGIFNYFRICFWMMCTFILLGEVKSVYVRNVPSNATAFEIEVEFKKFGKIRQQDGVAIRTRKVSSFSILNKSLRFEPLKLKHRFWVTYMVAGYWCVLCLCWVWRHHRC